MDINEVRLRRIRKIIAERHQGISAQFAQTVGMQAAYVSRLWTSRANHKRNIGEKLARRIETAYGLPVGWLDYDESGPVTESILLAGYKAATKESQGWMETIARRALEKPLGKDDSSQ